MTCDGHKSVASHERTGGMAPAPAPVSSGVVDAAGAQPPGAAAISPGSDHGPGQQSGDEGARRRDVKRNGEEGGGDRLVRSVPVIVVSAHPAHLARAQAKRYGAASPQSGRHLLVPVWTGFKVRACCCRRRSA